MAKADLDDLDRKLIELLAQDARVSNRKIATRLGVTEGTVRGRIKRLQQERLIRFTAITGMEMGPRVRMALIWIQTDVNQVQKVGNRLRDDPEISAVLVLAGRFNLLAICLFRELDELVDLAADRILALPGVRHVETAIAVRTAKYNARIARIVDGGTPIDD
ncbi:MAG: Lrp/AsnC family transcriptional regulator [Sphingopyxis sp.]|jgi:DNA-binding Lrp family transcriptional regulator|uniref:Lrp/AsnC family transcriptional regulator n=1 Tax=Sphingopyxis sp. TaxID=1908224 RepID=UPI0032ED4D82